MNGSARSCPICGTENPAGRNFCSSCGEKLPATASLASDGDASSGRRFSWPIAISLFVTLAIVGVAIGYFAGSRGGDETDRTEGTGTEATAAQGTEGPLPQVLCRVGGFDDLELVLQTKPSECEVLADGAPTDAPAAATASVSELDWLEWGEEEAIANGQYFITSVGPRPAVIRLEEPKVVCAELVFSQLSIELDESEPQPFVNLPIEGCPSDGSSEPATTSDDDTVEAILEDFDTGDGQVAEIPPAAEGADAFIIKSWQTCPSGWEKRRSRNNQTGQVDTGCHRFGS